MFCNECGQQNKDGAKFCVHCGAALKQPGTTGTSVGTSAGFNAPAINIGSLATIKKFVMPLVVLILVIIAAVNVISARTSIFNVNIYNDEQSTVRGTFAETGSYVYCTGSGLVRIDKSSYDTKKISNKSVTIIAATSNGIYCVDTDSNACYMVKDSSDELEKLDGGSVSNSNLFFMSDKYNYVLTTSGKLTKRLNSKDSFTKYSEIIHEEWDGYSAITARQYKDYIYVTRTDSLTSSNADYDFVRISLTSGKEEELCDEHITYFDITDNKIVYMTSDNTIHSMSLNGNDDSEIVDIDAKSISSFVCCNNSMYYYNKGNYKYDLSSGNIEELSAEYSGLQKLNSCLAYYTSATVYLYDYSGNELRTVEL